MSRIVAVGIVLLLIGYSVQQSNRMDAPSTAQRAEDAVDKKPDPPKKTDAPPKKTDAECRLDLHCWAELHLIAASVRCARPIERLASFQAEWTNSWYEQKMTHFRWDNREIGTVMYIGDRIKFQNSFGAWRPYTYFCTYDPVGEKVVLVEAIAGILPNKD